MVSIVDLTDDLRVEARRMEKEEYPVREVVRPAPLRVLGRRGRGTEKEEFLGSRWGEA